MDYKGYIIERGENISQLVVRHTGKGSLPKTLSGAFTSAAVAQKQIDTYLETKKKQG